MLARFEQRFAQFTRHPAGKSSHLLLLRRWHRCGHGSRRHIELLVRVALILAALAESRRHERAFYLCVAADGAADQGFLFLAFVGLAVLEPTFEFMAFGAAQAIKDH